MGADLALAAAGGLVLRADGDSGFRLWWGDEDWLGAIGLGAGEPPLRALSELPVLHAEAAINARLARREVLVTCS